MQTLHGADFLAIRKFKRSIFLANMETLFGPVHPWHTRLAHRLQRQGLLEWAIGEQVKIILDKSPDVIAAHARKLGWFHVDVDGVSRAGRAV